MPRKRRTGKARKGELTNDQFWELTLGPPAPDDEAFTSPHRLRRSAFESPFLRRAAWHEHRGEIMEFHNPGQRPWAWWEFEAPERPRKAILKVSVPAPELRTGQYDEFEEDEEDQADALKRLGLLEPWEAAQLAAWAQIRAAPEEEELDAEKLPL